MFRLKCFYMSFKIWLLCLPEDIATFIVYKCFTLSFAYKQVSQLLNLLAPTINILNVMDIFKKRGIIQYWCLVRCAAETSRNDPDIEIPDLTVGSVIHNFER